MEAIATINQFNITKSEIKSLVRRAKDDILMDGNYDILQIMANLKAMEEVISGIKKEILDAVFEEADRYGEKTFKLHGIEFTKMNRRTYDYSNNPKWTALKAEMTGLETMLKNLTGEMADPETGEILYPAMQKLSQTISITLPD